MVPLFGVLFSDWDVGLVLGLFWIENLIIGVLNLLKMLIVGVRQKAAKAMFLCPFFVFHYGLFCLGHGTLMWEILDLGEINHALSPLYHIHAEAESGFASIAANFGGLFGGLFGEGLALVFNFIELYKPTIYLAILVLCCSHIVRLIENFILRGGILKETVDTLMVRPYGQIIVMHIGLLVGGLLAEKFDSPVWLLAALVIFKLVVDIVQLRRRNKKQAQALTKGI